jgi:hypothetical protein
MRVAGGGRRGDGVATLGDGVATVGDGVATLGDGGSTLGGGVGVCVVGRLDATEVWKMSANWRSAMVCASPSVAKGPWGSRFSRACTKSLAANMAASVWLMVGTLQVEGKKLVVSAVRVPRVSGMYEVWQR